MLGVASLLSLCLLISTTHAAPQSCPAASSIPSITTEFGTAGFFGTTDGTGTSASLDSPVRIASDLGGTLYVTQNFRNSIRKINLISQAVTTITPIGAPLSNPYGIVVDSSGNIYVANGYLVWRPRLNTAAIGLGSHTQPKPDAARCPRRSTRSHQRGFHPSTRVLPR